MKTKTPTRLAPGTVFKLPDTSYSSLYLTQRSAQGENSRLEDMVTWTIMRGQTLLVLGGCVPNNKRRGFAAKKHTFEVAFGAKIGWLLLSDEEINQAIIVNSSR